MPQVFLTYSSKDRDFVADLATRLRNEGVDVWYDQWEIRVGDSIVDKIQQGIASSDYLIVILSKNSVTSKWVKEELASATIKTIQKGAFVLPVLLEDCDIPEFLRHRRYANFKDDPKGAFAGLISSIIPQRPLPIHEGQRDQRIIDVLSRILVSMIVDYDSVSEERRNQIVAEVATAYEEFKNSWGMSSGVYKAYINECIEEKRVLSLVEFIERSPKIINKYPNAAEEITVFLVNKL